MTDHRFADEPIGYPWSRSAATTCALVLAALCACAGMRAQHAEPVPAFLLGEFTDDYGSRYTIDAESWVHHPDTRYHIREWHVGERFLIAQNDSANASDPGLWTRIDWLRLGNTTAYEWAYCYAAWRAGSPDEAVAAPATLRDTPRTGCNGFPFSRMIRVVPVRRRMR